jgi:hypothetical protein
MDQHKRRHCMGRLLGSCRRFCHRRHKRQDSSFRLRELLYVGNSYDYSF